jgi:PAS domain S-box-containing protein
VLTDLDLPDSQAWDTFATLHARFPHMPIVVLTGREDEALAVDTVRAGAEDYLYKREMSGSLLAHALLYAIERQRTKDALRQAHAALETRVEERTAELAEANAQLQAELVAREQMEAQLRFQARLLNQIRDSIVATDLEGRITYTNEANARALKTRPEQLVGRSVHDLGEDPARGATQQEIIDKTLADGTWQGEVINYAHDGMERIWETRTWVVRDEQGEPEGMVGVSTDITERRYREARIRYLNMVLQAIRDVNQLITQEPDRDRLLQRACESLIETLGFHAAWIALAESPRHATAVYAAGFTEEACALMAHWKHERLPPCATAALSTSADTVMVLTSAECCECPRLQSGKGAISRRDSGALDASGALIAPLQYRDKGYGMLTLYAPEPFSQDTEVHALVAEVAGDLAFALWKLEAEAAHARAEDALRESERKYRTLFEHMAQGVFYQRADGMLVDVNPAALDMLGLTHDQFLGKTSRDPSWRVVREDGTPLPVEQHASMVALRTGKPVRDFVLGVYNPRRQDWVWMSVNAIPQFKASTGEVAQVFVTLHDITARRRMEQALRESENRYRTLLEHFPNGALFMFDRDLRYTLCGGQGLEAVGLRAEQLVGKTIYEVFPPEMCAIIERHCRPVFQGQSSDYEITYHGNIYANWAVPIIREGGGVNEGIVFTLDITERKRAERALQESEARYRAFMENFPGIAFQGTVDYRPFFQHGALEEITGYRAPDFAEEGLTWRDLIYPEDLPIVDETLEALTSIPRHKETREYRIVRKDGALRWVRESIQNLVDEDGDVYAVQGVLYDITDRQRAEIALRESEERLALAVAGTGVGLWDWQVQTGEMVVNARWAEMLGYTLDELTPINIETWIALCHPQDLQRANEHLARHFAGETAQYTCELRMKHRDGGWIWVLDQGKVFAWDADGDPIRMAGTHLDITERKEAEQALARYAEELQRSNDELQQFAYTVSHDLKSPLRMVKSYMRLLEEEYEGQLNAEADQFIRFAVEGAQRMEQLIDGLLAYARVGTQGEQLAPTDAEVVLTRVLESLYFEITEQGAEVTHDPLPTVLADVTQLAQIFQNLINNALKFQPPGRDMPPRVHISATPWEEGRRVAQSPPDDRSTGVMWRFSVTDNGIGIAPEHIDRLFSVFQRLHTVEEYEGTGIGLAICKRIVARHGGRIWVESEVDKGSTFHFTLWGGKGAEDHERQDD